MNGSTARTMRKEARRVLSTGALEALHDTQQNTQTLVQSVQSAHRRIEEVSERLESESTRWDVALKLQLGECRGRLTVLEKLDTLVLEGLSPLLREHDRLLHRGFWGRLRWLWSGK